MPWANSLPKWSQTVKSTKERCRMDHYETLGFLRAEGDRWVAWQGGWQVFRPTPVVPEEGQRRWSAEQLGLAPETSLAEARPHLLRQLAKVGFAPSREWLTALRLSGPVRSNRGLASLVEPAYAAVEAAC